MPPRAKRVGGRRLAVSSQQCGDYMICDQINYDIILAEPVEIIIARRASILVGVNGMEKMDYMWNPRRG